METLSNVGLFKGYLIDDNLEIVLKYLWLIVNEALYACSI